MDALSSSAEYDADLAQTAARMDADTALSALRECGCLVLRQALDNSVLQEIHDTAKACYDDMETRQAAGQLSKDEARRNHGYGILRPFEDDLTTSDGRLIRDAMLDLVDSSVLASIVEAYLGDDTSLLLEACHIRKQGPGQPGRPVPLHQDCSVMRMTRGRLLNFWVPLVDGAGATAPGLEFYPRSLDRILDCKRRPSADTPRARMYSNFEIHQDDVRAAIGDLPPWRPVLDRGDVICLDGWSVHRTNFQPDMTRTRYGFEVRFCATHDLQPDMPGKIVPYTRRMQ